LESETFYLNGIDARTGDYARPPMDLDEVVRGALGRVVPADQLQELMDKWSRQGETSYALADDDLDPSNLADAGWGVVFPYGVDPAIRKALAPLLALRERQVRGIAIVEIEREDRRVEGSSQAAGDLSLAGTGRTGNGDQVRSHQI